MRIVFLTADDEYAGAMQKYVYASHPDWVVGSVLSSCLVYRKNIFQAAVMLLKKSGFRYAAEMLKMKLLRRLFPRRMFITAGKLAASYGVETWSCSDINTPEAIRRLSSWKPDLLISTNFNHYIGKKVRELPVRGTWNLHKSRLPEYRGMAPGFHALLEGKDTAGATLHIIDKGIDTGAILAQTDVPVKSSDTVFSLNMRIADAGGRLLEEYLETINLERITATPQPDGSFRCFSYPERDELRLFRKKGLSFM